MSAKLQHQIKQSLIWRGIYFIIAFATTIISSRVLQAELSGEFSYFITLLSLLVLVGSCNMDSSFTYYSSSNKISDNKLIFSGLLFIIVIYLLLNKFLSTNIYLQLINTKNLQINVYQCSINYFIGILLISFSTALFYSKRNFVTPNAVLIFFGIIYLILIGWRLHQHYPKSIIATDFCSMTLMAGVVMYISYIIINQSYNKIQLVNLQEVKQLFSFALIIMLSNVVFFFVYKLDYWFVKSWCTQEGDLGNYIQASKFGQIILVVPQILASTIFPQIANEAQKKEVVAIIGKLVRIFTVVFLLLFIFTLLMGKYFFPWLCGATFNKMYVPMLILIPGIYCLAISSLFSAYFSGTKQNKINLYAALVAIILVVCLSFGFKSHYSIIIAAAISTISYFFESLFVGFNFIKREEVVIAQFLTPTKKDFIWLLATIKGRG